MSIQILGGHARGHALFVPKGDETRPTTVMLRRKFFDAHQDCTDMIFIDLCAGTGAMAFEALSRGAKEVICVEKHKYVFKALKQNAKSMETKIENPQIRLENTSADIWLERFLKVYESFDDERKEDTFIFIDPPYEEKALYKKCLSLVKDSGFVGQLWIESDRQKGIVEKDVNECGFVYKKVYKQGTTFIARISVE